MKVRRSSRSVDLKNLPLDGLDMFLLIQLESELATSELCDIAPCDRAETMRRVRQLASFGVVELVAETAAEQAELGSGMGTRDRTAVPEPRPAQGAPRAPAPAEPVPVRYVAQRAPQPRPTAFDDESTAPASHAVLFDEESTTLRPPADKRTRAVPAVVVKREDEAVTLRPPKPVSVKDLMSAAEDLTGKIKVKRSSGVVEKSPRLDLRTPAEAAGTDGRVGRDQSVFSRQTLVDVDVNDRARALEEPAPARRR